MYPRLQRQNSFGPRESKSTLVISRIMELKILEGESSIPNASPIVLESINTSLQSLIDSCDSSEPVVCELPKYVKNVTISQCDLSDRELIDKRYSEYFDGYSLANNVQYIPVEIECLSNMSSELCKSILALLVSIVFEYISDDNNLKELELIKWGSVFLQRIGKFLGLTELDITSIIKPVSENLELKQLGMNFDDLELEKQIHIDYIKEQLAPMQENINEFFKQTVGTFSDGDFDNDLKDFDTFKPTEKQSKYTEKRSVSFDETVSYMDKTTSSLEKSDEHFQKYDVTKYAQGEKEPSYNQEFTTEDFDLLLNDEDGEVDQEEESFKRNFIETYNKDTNYTFDASRYEIIDTSKGSDQFDEFSYSPSRLSKSTAQKDSDLFDEFKEPFSQHSSQEFDKNKATADDDPFSAFSTHTEELGRSNDTFEASNVDQFSTKPDGVTDYADQFTAKSIDLSDKSSSQVDFMNINDPFSEFSGSISRDSELTNKESEVSTYNEPNNQQLFLEEYEVTEDRGTHERHLSAIETEYKDGEASEGSPVVQETNSDKSRVDLNNLLSNFLTQESSIDSFNSNEEDMIPVTTDLDTIDTSVMNRMVSISDSALDHDNNTNVGEEEFKEEEEFDLLRDLEKTIIHRSSLPSDDFDSLLNDMSNMNLPPKKNKSLLSKIGSNITKKINKVFSINSDKMSKIPSSQSVNTVSSSYPHQDYLNNLELVESPPDIVAVLVRNLVLKYIVNGYNDSRSQAIFGIFGNLLGVTDGSLLSIENNMVSDLVGIMDLNAAKTSTKKMTRRLKILSATLGGTALLALTAGVASPVLAVGVAFLGLSGTGVSTYLNSSEGTNILKNMFGLNVSLTQFKIKKDQLSNLQFIQLNPSTLKDSLKDHDSARFLLKDGTRLDSVRESDDSNSNYIGICVCVGNNIFLNEIFFFENNSVDFRSSETNRHFDSEYIDVWKQQFPVPINDLYLLKWESKLLASLHRMLLKLKALSIYDKCMELYRTFNNTVYTTQSGFEDDYNEDDDVMSRYVRESSGGNKYRSMEGSSGNYYSGVAGDGAGGEESRVGLNSGYRRLRKDYKNFRNDVRTINWPVGLVQLCSNLDNCWLVCRNRAETCGALLANAICDKMLTGDRHISLVGYSMGARVIFYCLLSLFERNKINTVKDVVLMGLPSTAGHAEWSKCSSVVSGRLINVYNENDWVLAFLYRYTSNYKVAGLAPVVHEKVENYNATSLFTSHVDYLDNVSKIASHLNIQL